MRHRTSLAVSVTCLAAVVLAVNKPGGAMTAASPGNPEVNSAIDRWSAQLKSPMLSWTSDIVVRDSSGQAASSHSHENHFQVTGYAAKPDKAYIEVREGGKLVRVFSFSDRGAYDYNPLLRSYQSADKNEHFHSDDLSAVSMLTATSFLAHDAHMYASLAPANLLDYKVAHTSARTEIVGKGEEDGDPKTAAEGTTAKRSYGVSLLFDNASGLPVTVSQHTNIDFIVDDPDAVKRRMPVYSLSVTENFKKIKFPKALPPSTFAWRPPAGAKQEERVDPAAA